ncbi:MAG: HPr family phosphocarrier protein [Gammaproteobacteria bacterium]|nr:HPr family phosphocarrier protein [Gammaproteobacteria bacterium]MCD8542727.1 HPr family phosphocarrier protein [Gammaproteobacteria bacterium]
MKEKIITIINKLGLHARASSKLVTLASKFHSQIELCRDTKIVNAKSIMGVMMLAAPKGTDLILKIQGDDEDAAMKALTSLIANKFDEAE